MAEMMGIQTAQDPSAAVIELLSTHPPCFKCVTKCMDAADVEACIKGCVRS
jgi:hypothetical protein